MHMSFARVPSKGTMLSSTSTRLHISSISCMPSSLLSKSRAAMVTPAVRVERFPPRFSDWVVDVDNAADKVNKSEEEAAWAKPSIYRVTSFARSHNPKAFTPQVISFGPIHHDEERLKETEEHKHRALVHFLHRAEKPLGPFATKLRSILKLLQDSYKDLDKKWKENPEEFLKVMLLDGCFMIEVLRLEKGSGREDYASNDPVFSSKMRPTRMPYIKRDMLLLENQLPLLVLKALLEVENRGRTDYQYINDLVLKFCGESLEATLSGLASHPLELYRMSILEGYFEESATVIEPSTMSGTIAMENAVELREHGVRFRSNKNKSTSLRDITFDTGMCKGWLNLPVIPVDDATEHLLLNMTAYEQIHVGVGNEITSYLMFMGALIKTEDDVKLLQKKGIVINSLGSHKAVVELFNSFTKEAAHDPEDKLNIVKSKLKNFIEQKSNKWWADLKHNYLPTPWKAVALFFASLVILFTFIQTFYSALSFYHQK